MTIIAPAPLERALLRGMRPDAHLFVRPGWRRHVRSGFEDDLPFSLYEQKYRSDQPRLPAGSREGGNGRMPEAAVVEVGSAAELMIIISYPMQRLIRLDQERNTRKGGAAGQLESWSTGGSLRRRLLKPRA
jgi:hypothetical protein